MIIDTDPQDPIWAGWMPAPIVRDMQRLEYDDRLYWLEINVTAQLTGREPAGAPLPVRADLGRRIADLIRTDCADAPQPIPIRRRDPEEARAQPCRCSLLPLADEIGPDM